MSKTSSYVSCTNSWIGVGVALQTQVVRHRVSDISQQSRKLRAAPNQHSKMEMEKNLCGEGMDVETELHFNDFLVFRAEDSEEHHHTLVSAPRFFENAPVNSGNTYNLLMADVSGSMYSAWPLVIEAWNASISDVLTGDTKLFLFDDHVRFLRSSTKLSEADSIGGGTNITEALRCVRHEVENCKANLVHVFIITDGCHGGGAPYPEEEINQMRVPPGKTVNVYLLGISSYFPVNYSIDIRSHLHSGNANMPSLYWAKEIEDIGGQMDAIRQDLKTGSVEMTLNHEGYILPGLGTTPTIHSGEWMYFPVPPEEIADLKVIISDEEREIPHIVRDANVSILVDHVYPQWNSVLIQQHRKKQCVPKDTFKLMDSLFNANLNKLKNSTCHLIRIGVKNRLARKHLRDCEFKYANLMNMSRSVIEVEGKYENEIELANIILKSTVSGLKYDTKNLKLRGHGLDDFKDDCTKFRDIYMKVQAAIKALPPPDPEDCCRITMSSTLSDLQDEDFLLMLDEGKYDLLRNFTMTGIPAYAPVRDASQINVWTLTIRHMLVAPFTILSQRAIEEKASIEGPDMALGLIDKDVQLKADDEKSRFNIIIPIVPASASTVLKPVVRSNLYAIMATFCILKNPHIMDHSAHLAALACAWVRSVADHPPTSRPEYVTERLAAITATAELYMDRKSVVTYLKGINSEPHQALMTESTETSDEQTLKCESLVKPLFFLGLRKDQMTASQLQVLFPLLLAEFVGRCLSNYKTNETDATPFTDFFAMELNDPKKKEEWLMNASQPFISEFKAMHTNLLKDFYAPENAQKGIMKLINSKKATLDDQIIDAASFELNMEKVKHLRNPASCGDVNFYTFRAWAQEMGVPEDEINAAYDPSQVFVYVCEALCYRNSRDRLSREPSSHAECLEEVKKRVKKENGKALMKAVADKISEVIVGHWKKEYFTVHEAVVLPMSPEQVVAEAQARDIEVTQETLKEVYRYDAECMMVRRACQIPTCPFYLMPSRRFNQHLAVERVCGKFPHSLHLVSREMCDGKVNKVVEEIVTGSHSGRQNRRKCPISEPMWVQKLTPEIEKLQQIYKQN